MLSTTHQSWLPGGLWNYGADGAVVRLRHSAPAWFGVRNRKPGAALGRSGGPHPSAGLLNTAEEVNLRLRVVPRVGGHELAFRAATACDPRRTLPITCTIHCNPCSITRSRMGSVARALGGSSGSSSGGSSSISCSSSSNRSSSTGRSSSKCTCNCFNESSDGRRRRRRGAAPAATAGTGAVTDGRSPSAAVASVSVAASVAAAAVAGAVASAAPQPPPRATAMGLLQRAASLLRSHFIAILLLYAVKDGAAFLLHRVTQRLTNHAAEVLLGVRTPTAGNPWWLYLDPVFIRANPGYEVLIGLFFLACLPFTIALNSLAFSTAALLCVPQRLRREGAAAAGAPGPAQRRPAAAAPGPAPAPAHSGSARSGVGAALHLPLDDSAAAALADLGVHALPTAPPPPELSSSPAAVASSSSSSSSLPEEPPATISMISAATSLSAAPPQPLPPLGEGDAGSGGGGEGEAEGGPWVAVRAAVASLTAVLPAAAAIFRRVWWVDLQFNVRALPLQGLCLLVLPALWALPRLMRIQLALPAAVLEGRAGRDALARSSNLMTSSLAAYGMPFAGLLAAGRLVEYVQGAALVLIPPRWWREVVELPLLIAGAFLLLKAAVHRLQDLLPLAAYAERTEQEAAAALRLQQDVLLLQQQQQPNGLQHQQQHQQDATAGSGLSAADAAEQPVALGRSSLLPGAAAAEATAAGAAA